MFAYCAIPVALLGFATVAKAEDAGSLAELVKKGTVKLDFRYRYEFVDQDGKDEDAEAC